MRVREATGTTLDALGAPWHPRSAPAPDFGRPCGPQEPIWELNSIRMKFQRKNTPIHFSKNSKAEFAQSFFRVTDVWCFDYQCRQCVKFQVICLTSSSFLFRGRRQWASALSNLQVWSWKHGHAGCCILGRALAVSLVLSLVSRFFAFQIGPRLKSI